MSEENSQYKSDLCSVTMTDSSMMEAPPPCPGVKHDQVMMEMALCWGPEEQLEKLTSLLDLDQEEVNKRVNICNNLQKIFANKDYNCRDVLPFGSSLNGLGFPGCDLDIYMDLDNKYADNDGNWNNVNNEKQKVRIAAEVLLSIPQYSRLTQIINARVPILKFIHRPTGISCDISFKNRMSVRNTEYIRLCTKTDTRVRPLMLAVRYFAKHHGLAGGGGGLKMSSYALTMLVIVFLQMLDNPILHPVIDLKNVPGLKPDVINGWNCSFSDNLSQLRPLPVNESSVFDLMRGFFSFVSNCLSEVVLCPLLGRVIPKDKLTSSFPPEIDTSTFLSMEEMLKIDSPLCVQDPFELDHNVCRNLSERAVLNFTAHFAEAHKWMEKIAHGDDDRPTGGLCALFKPTSILNEDIK